MSLAFHKVTFGPLQQFQASAPNGAIIGLVGANGSGASELLRLAAGVLTPKSGSISGGKKRRLIGPSDPIDLAATDVLLLDNALALADSLGQLRTLAILGRLRRAGTTVLMFCHDEELLRRVCDELWWVQDGKLAQRGDPHTILTAYRKSVADQFRASGEAAPAELAAQLRRGDRRAEVVRVDLLGDSGNPTSVWRSGERVEIRVGVRFAEAVESPVVGILIRNRIGLDVYGTNSELERARLGPRSSGDRLALRFQFTCDLCPGEYTLTVASHDPDGTRHDWLEEAVAFTVTDARYTAGVANLRAKLVVET